MADWFDGYYNRGHCHSPIGYVSPIEYEQQSIITHRLSLVEP